MDGFEIHIFSDPKYAKIIRGAVEHVCDLCGYSTKTRRAIVLAVDEAVTNIIRHAYRGETGHKIRIRCEILANSLQIVLQDFGIAATREKMKSRDLNDVRPGGLGIHFIKSTMDIVDYESSPTTGNKLKLVKYLPSKGKKDAEN